MNESPNSYDTGEFLNSYDIELINSSGRTHNNGIVKLISSSDSYR